MRYMAERILVTGASGFIGSHVADELSKQNYEVVLFDVRDSKWKNPRQTMITGDLQDIDNLIVITKGIDYVYHFAGIADIGECTEKRREVVLSNILGTVNLLEACQINKVKRFVFASSAYVFSKDGSFYRSSKRACESFIDDYHNKFGLDFTILRFGSLYGKRSNEKNGVYRVVKSILELDTYIYNGSGKEIREFINVKDAAKIAVDILDDTHKNKYLIITGIERYTMAELIEMVKEITGRHTKVIYSDSIAGHYTISPYHFEVEESQKLIANPYFDIGQGILSLIEDIKK
jgi:UDP-glucose 4-epimerase